MQVEDSILGLHVHRFITPTRFVCTLIPLGAVGIMETPQPLFTATQPDTTLTFQEAIPGHYVKWSSAKKCLYTEVDLTSFLLVKPQP